MERDWFDMNSLSFSSAMAAFAAASSGISTKPNPLERPDILSIIIFAEVTSPN
jgi:hypothetical protein